MEAYLPVDRIGRKRGEEEAPGGEWEVQMQQPDGVDQDRIRERFECMDQEEIRFEWVEDQGTRGVGG